MSASRSAAQGANENYGSIQITEDRAIYTDARGIRWRLYDFTLMSDGKKQVKVRVGALAARILIFVREDGRERRRIGFTARDDTLTPSFNHWQLQGAFVRRGKGWAFPQRDPHDVRDARG